MQPNDPTKPIDVTAAPDPVTAAHRLIDVAADEYARLNDAGKKAVRSLLRCTFVRVISELSIETMRQR